MTTSLNARLARIEHERGSDPLDRWLRSLSDEELDAEIVRVTDEIRGELKARGIACGNAGTDELIHMARELEVSA